MYKYTVPIPTTSAKQCSSLLWLCYGFRVVSAKNSFIEYILVVSCMEDCLVLNLYNVRNIKCLYLQLKRVYLTVAVKI